MNTNTKTMHISLPESLIESAKVQAEEGQYGNVSDYVHIHEKSVPACGA
jgi:Arc/MetJ-type ribon-helix-helix transcriptional regulator